MIVTLFAFLQFGMLTTSAAALSNTPGSALCSTIGNSSENQEKERKAISIAKLTPRLDGKRVTVRFKVRELFGIAQLLKEGQAPSFGIRSAKEHDVKNLDVWIIGKLANEMHENQTALGKANELKRNTVIEVSGIVSLHQDTSIGEYYSIKIADAKNFRILPPVKGKKLNPAKKI